MQSARIPRYSLYGEEASDGDLTFVHCRPIFSEIARQDWRIAPHRHDSLHQLVFVAAGTLTATIDGRDHAVTGPEIVSIPSHCVHGFAYAPGVDGRVITVAAPFLRTLTDRADQAELFGWLAAPAVARLAEGAAVARQAQLWVEHLEAELARREPGYVHVVGAILTQLFVAITRATEAGRRPADGSDAHHAIMEGFNALVEARYRDHWTVARYCAELGVSERRLARVCHASTGRSPLRLIHERVVQEAKRRLIYTRASVTQICYELGFKDPAYFSRYFRRQTGGSPSAFARKHRHGDVASAPR